jgi:hypothetical protein
MSMDSKLLNRLTVLSAAAIAAYFLTHLHHSAATNTVVFIYNTVTGEVSQFCAGVVCGRPRDKP